MKITPLLSVLALSSIALTGCAATTSDSITSTGEFAPTDSSESKMMDPAAGGAAAYSSDAQVITTASAYLTGEDPAAIADDVVTRVTAAKGKVDARSVQSDVEGVTSSVSLTVRIPAESLDQFLTGLESVATVHALSENAQDVTLIVTDYTSRIAALETSVARLVALQRSAKSTQELIEIETALTDRQAQLEQLNSEMRYYSDQIEMSTVQVDIGLPASATDPVPDDFWGGIQAGWKGLLAFFSGIVVALGVVIPWTPIVTGLGWLVWWLVRRRRTATPSTAKTRTPAKKR